MLFPRFRIQSIMTAIAAVAVLLSLVHFLSQHPVLLGISSGLLLLFGTSACILVWPFAVWNWCQRCSRSVLIPFKPTTGGEHAGHRDLALDDTSFLVQTTS